MNEPREVTSDWIVYPAESDKPFDLIPGLNVGRCNHGRYKLTKPHTIICSICEQVIMPPKQVEEIGDWINDLCRGA